MRRVVFIFILCLGSLIEAPGQEEQAGKLLSKAIYQEEVNGELDEAIKTYRLIIQQYPDNRKVSAEALLQLGICYEKIGIPQAFDTYRDIIDNYADQQDEVALARRRIDHLKAFEDDVKEKAEKQLKKGNELLMLWEYESAIKEYEKVIESRPNSVLAQNALYYIGQCWYEAGEYDAALISFEKLLDEYPGSNMTPVTELMVGRVHSAKENDETVKSINNSTDEGFIIDPKTGIKYIRVKSYTGKDDLIKYTTAALYLSPDGRFMVQNNSVIPVDGSEAFELVADKSATRSIYSPDMNKVAFYADEAIWVAPVSPETGHINGSQEKLLDGRYRYQHSVSWSPDGKSLAFQRYDDDHFKEIWTISVPDGSLSHVANDGFCPAWSPDGNSMAFWRNRGIWLIPAEGGEPRKIIEIGGWPFWSPDGKWLYHSNWEKSQFYNLADGQNINLVTPANVGDFLAFSPDCKRMLFYHPSYTTKRMLKVVSFSGGPAFAPGGRDFDIYDAEWSHDGRLLLAQAENEDEEITYWIVPFRGGGEPFRFDIDVSVDGEPFPFSTSPDHKKLAFTVSHEDGYKDLYVVPISIEDARTTGPAELVFERWTAGIYNLVFSWSPDGNNLVTVHENDIWVIPLFGGRPVQITDNPEEELWPRWSPDGRMIVYILETDTIRSAHIVPASGGQSTKMLKDFRTYSWSPDGQEMSVLFKDHISIVGFDGQVKRKIISLKDLDLDDTSSPDWSPDGKYLAFLGYKRGIEKTRVFTIPSAGGEVTELATEDDAYKESECWSPDGQWISYTTEEYVKVRPEGTLWEADFKEVIEKLQAE